MSYWYHHFIKVLGEYMFAFFFNSVQLGTRSLHTNSSRNAYENFPKLVVLESMLG